MSKFLYVFEIMNAWKNGKAIEREYRPGQWREVDLDHNYLEHFIANPENFRVKPELSPWTVDEVPVGALLRYRIHVKDSPTHLITGANKRYILSAFGETTPDMAKEYFVWKYPHETEWKPCGTLS